MNNDNSTPRLTNEIPVLRSMGLDSTLPDHTLVVIIVRLAFVLDESTHMPTTLMPATLIPHPNYNMNRIVVHDHIHANQDPILLLHHNSNIIDITIIFVVETRFRNVDGAPGDWSSDMRAAAATLLAFIREPHIVWACVFGGLVGVVLRLIAHSF